MQRPAALADSRSRRSINAWRVVSSSAAHNFRRLWRSASSVWKIRLRGFAGFPWLAGCSGFVLTVSV